VTLLLLANLFAYVSQVVIAGASETGLSCLERLLLQPCMRFTNLTLLAPGGVQTDSVIGCFTAARVARLGLHANVTMVDSHMVALEPEEQILMLADGTQLPFDLLTVATGLQVTQSLQHLWRVPANFFPNHRSFALQGCCGTVCLPACPATPGLCEPHMCEDLGSCCLLPDMAMPLPVCLPSPRAGSAGLCCGWGVPGCSSICAVSTAAPGQQHHT